MHIGGLAPDRQRYRLFMTALILASFGFPIHSVFKEQRFDNKGRQS